ncbi:MAG: phosphoribosyltransferase family protein [bacterium]|nr:phosphoribosyltransferase family protein [bacterium]
MGKINILSTSNEPFLDREEAGQMLGRALKKYKFNEAIVLGIPRGGIIIAMEICKIINSHLDVVLTHKIGSPYNPEYAIGAVSESGRINFGDRDFSINEIEDAAIKSEAEKQLINIRQRASYYRKILPKRELKNKTVIITDDGIATGATMKAALISAKNESPEKLIAALPVGPRDSIEEIALLCDEIICLRVPAFFGAVGAFYINFEQTTDEEILEILKEEQERLKYG